MYLEVQARDNNRERIWEEMERRAKGGGVTGGGGRKGELGGELKGGKQAGGKVGGKKGKRGRGIMDELAQMEEKEGQSSEGQSSEGQPPSVRPESLTQTPKKKESLVDKAQNFYKKADEMAAAQALLLNKDLEEKGLLKKITDVTGLKVATVADRAARFHVPPPRADRLETLSLSAVADVVTLLPDPSAIPAALEVHSTLPTWFVVKKFLFRCEKVPFSTTKPGSARLPLFLASISSRHWVILSARCCVY